MLKKLKTLRINRTKSITLNRGKLPKVNFEYSLIEKIISFILILIFIITFMVWLDANHPIWLYKSILVTFLGIWSWLIFWIIKHPKCLTSKITIKPLLIYFLGSVIIIINGKRELALISIINTILLYLCWPALVNFKNITALGAELKQQELNQPSNNFGLWLGKSTGLLASLWHCTGISGNQHVTLRTEDACQNILVLGGIGSGKTTAVMQPLLLQCLDQQCGGLIFDIKGDVKTAVTSMSKVLNKQPILIGPDHLKLNLLSGLTPEIAASFLKSAFLLNSKGHLDPFWIDTATELCRNTLGMLLFIPEHYNLQSLYQYLFDPKYQKILDLNIKQQLLILPEPQARLLRTYCSYNQLIFLNFDPKVKSGVLATVAQALSPFSHPALFDAFCTHEHNFNMEDLTKGKIYVVDLPLAVWGLGAKVVYTFIKLRFFNLMQNRAISHSAAPVFFMCDEYQEIISANQDGLSDLNFWDKSRSSKTIGIISSQSIASFYAAIGSRDLAHAILQNFRQKLCLRTEDPDTLNFIGSLLGQAKIQRLSKSHDSNHKISQTIFDAKETVIDPQFFRKLWPKHAIAILSIKNYSMDDLLRLEVVYI